MTMFNQKPKILISFLFVAVTIILFPSHVLGVDRPQGDGQYYKPMDSPFMTYIDKDGKKIGTAGVDIKDEDYTNVIVMKYQGSNSSQSMKLITGQQLSGPPHYGAMYSKASVWRMNSMGTYNGKDIDIIITESNKQPNRLSNWRRTNTTNIGFRWEQYGGINDYTMEFVYSDSGLNIVPEEGDDELYVIFSYELLTSRAEYKRDPFSFNYVNDFIIKNGDSGGIDNIVLRETPYIDNVYVVKDRYGNYKFIEPSSTLPAIDEYRPDIFYNMNLIFKIKDANTKIHMTRNPSSGNRSDKYLASQILFRDSPIYVKAKNGPPYVVDTENDRDGELGKAKLEVTQALNGQDFDHHYSEDFDLIIEIKENEGKEYLDTTSEKFWDSVKVVDRADTSIDYTNDVVFDKSNTENGKIKIHFPKETLKKIGAGVVKVTADLPMDESNIGIQSLYKDGFFNFGVKAYNTDSYNPDTGKKFNTGVMKVGGNLPWGTVVPQEVVQYSNSNQFDIDKLIVDLGSIYPNDEVTRESFTKDINFDTVGLNKDVKVVIKSKFSGKTTTYTVPVTVVDKRELTVNFIREDLNDKNGKPVVLRNPEKFLVPAGKEYDLAGDPKMKDILAEIEGDNFQANELNQKKINITTNQSIDYKFSGMLFISSRPATMTFDRTNIHDDVTIQTSKVTYKEPFTVWDNTGNKTGWSLSAKLDKVLTSKDNENAKLPNALKYKTESGEIKTLSDGSSTTIATKTGISDDEYELSKDWEEKDTGLLVEVKNYEVAKQLGIYDAKIHWNVGVYP